MQDDSAARRKTRTWRASDLLVDEGQSRVERGGEVLPLPKLSFDLLCALLQAAPNFVTNEELMATVWPGLVVSPETVTQRVKLLRDALQDDPRQPRYIEGLRSRGYRFIVPVGADTGALAPAGGGTRRGWWWAAAATMAAAVLWLALNEERNPFAAHPKMPADEAAAQELDANTVAVLPFTALSAGSDDAYIGPGVSEAILSRLASVHGLMVIARESAALAATLDTDSAAAGRRLGAAYVVEGSVQRRGGSLRVAARLIETRRNVQLWAQQFDSEVANIFQIQDEIATQVVAALESRVANLTPVMRSSQRAVNPQAYLSFLHGRTLVGRFTVREAEAAAAEFARAIDLDAGFAAAYVALYDARMQAASLRRQPLPEARRKYADLLEHALQLDPDSGAAWYARAMWSDADPAGIEAAFRRGMELDPGNSRGLTAYSEFLDLHRRPDEASALLELALRVDPLAARARFRLAQRNFDAVGADVEKFTLSVLELDPQFYPALQRYAKYRWMQHADIAQAVAIVERAIAADPENPWGPHTAAAFYLDVGDLAAARAVVRLNTTAGDSTRAMLAAYEGDWRKAGQAALDTSTELFGAAERWCVVPALRDYALRSGEYDRVITVISARYNLPLQRPWHLTVFNFREAQLLAHLLLAQGHTAEASARLGDVLAWIDANGKYGPVYNVRTRAQTLMLLGQRDEALSVLAESFVQLDYTHWWYALERDPTWDTVRRDPRFVAIAHDVHLRVAAQRKALEVLREKGEVPRRMAPT